MGGDLSARHAECERLLRDSAIAGGMTITGDGRVSEADAAALLGFTAGGFRNMRQEGKGPRSFGLGVGGSRVSYRLADLASWIEAAREKI